MRSLVLLLFLSSAATAQDPFRNRVTFSGAWSRQIAPIYSGGALTATGLGISYGYRPFRIMEIEAGTFVGLQPGRRLCSAHGCFDPNDRYIWIPVGVRFVAPLGRVELSAGGGGMWGKYWVSNSGANPFNVFSRAGWGGYFVGGAALALDHNRHWWLGVTPRVFLWNPRYSRDRWMMIAGEVSWRF